MANSTHIAATLLHQTRCLVPNQRVAVNIGLGARMGQSPLSMAKMIDKFELCRAKLRDAFDYILSLGMFVPSAGGEPTVVIEAYLKEDADTSTAMADFVLALDCDCIALYYYEFKEGCLFGPDRSKWGDFNPDLFRFPETKEYQ